MRLDVVVEFAAYFIMPAKLPSIVSHLQLPRLKVEQVPSAFSEPGADKRWSNKGGLP